MNNKVMKTISCVGCLLLFYAFAGCGASRQESDFSDEAVDLDQLLGEEGGGQSSDESEQAEVLRLLGIKPSEQQAQPANVSTINQPVESSSLQADVEKLKDELTEKDREISELRSKLTEKEMRVTDLETRAEQAQRNISPRPIGQPGEPSREFKSRYEQALGTFKARDYRKAISLFTELLGTEANNSLSDNCQYWIGESYYGLGDYNQAITEFERVFSFPNSNKSDDAQLKLGLCYFKLGDRDQARSEFDRLLAIYPGSEYVAVAQKYIGQL
ncbi:MAG: tetratricopeptide repeat protein [bacterium]